MACALAAWAWSPVPARADSVTLSNGNVMEGLIVREDAAELELDIGYGSVLLKKAEIDRVVRSSGRQKEALKARQRDAEFASGRRVPEAAAAVYERFRSLTSLREKALDAKAFRERMRVKEDELERSIASSKAAYPAAASRLRRLNRGAPGYRDAVLDVNELAASIEAGQAEISQGRRKASESQSEINDYLTALDDFRELMGADPGLSAKTPGSVEDEEFDAWVRRSFSAMEADTVSESVGETTQGSHVLVSAAINGKARAKLIVDTGATVVLLTARLADQVGVEGAGSGFVQVKVADGRQVPARTVVLDSVQVGSMRAEQVEAAILPEFEPGLDGLLGMSFLKRFDVRVDGERGRLILRQLK